MWLLIHVGIEKLTPVNKKVPRRENLVIHLYLHPKVHNAIWLEQGTC